MNRRPPTRRTRNRSQQGARLPTGAKRRLLYVNRPQLLLPMRSSLVSTNGGKPVVLNGYYPVHIAAAWEVQD